MTDTTKTDDVADLKAMIDKLQESVTKLENQNKELKREKDAANTRADEAKQALEDAEEAKTSATETLEQQKKRLETKHQSELEKITKERDSANATLKSVLIDNAITKTLVDSNVPAHFHEPLTAMFMTGAEIKEGKAFRGDAELAEAMKSYFDSEAGAHYVMEPVNSGGGSTGANTRVADDWTKPPQTAQEMNAWMKLAATSPQRANSLAESWGKPELKV